MFRIVIAALLVLIGAALPARAAESAYAAQDSQPQETAAFARLLEKLKQHPEIRSYASRTESSRDYAEGELGLPDPVLFMEQQNYPIGSSTSQMLEMKSIGFRQEIPAFGTRGAKSEKIQAEAHKSRLAQAYAFAAMKAKLIAVLAAWRSIREQEKLLDEQAGLFSFERTSLKGRIAANQTGVSRLSMSQADSTEVQLRRADLEEKKHGVMDMLANMVGETLYVGPPPVKLAAWDNDPDKTYPVKIAAEDITMARKEVDMRDAEFGPHFEVQAGYGRMNNGDNAGTVMVGLSIPLWASESQRPKLNGAKAALHSSELDQDAVKRDTIEKLNYLKAQIDISAQKIELLETKDTDLATAARALAREYEAGKADMAMILKTRRDALSVRISLAQEQAKRIALIADFNHYIIGDAL
ncbi:MAG: TolC family protein [Pseudomonadota bacterium]|nr:TolC family protein [Pseudomonadota bacterium]MDE3038580.1 TolC family protein [Pseudomonadota bacterium]